VHEIGRVRSAGHATGSRAPTRGSRGPQNTRSRAAVMRCERGRREIGRRRCEHGRR
jgi:hypothetical protein